MHCQFSDMKPKFGIYFGMPSHEEYGLPVMTMGIIQGGIHSDGICTIYAQEVKDSEGTFCWTTTKTCAWCNCVFSNGESAMNHMKTPYRIVLVCPFCAICGSQSYPSMRDHVKKCKGDHSELLESSDAEPGQYEPCFHKGDKHLPKEGLASCTRFTYKLDNKWANTKTIQQLIDGFKARAEKEVSAVCQAHALHGKCSGLATHGNSSKKSLYDVETDAEGPPNKQKKSHSSSATPAKAKPPASAAVGKAPKDSNIPEVKNLDDDELDYDDDVDDNVASDGSDQPSGPLNDDQPKDMDKTPQQDSFDQSSGDRLVEHSDGDCKRSENRSRSRSGSRSHQGSQSPSPMTKFVLEIKAGIMIIGLTAVITIGTVVTGTILVMMCMKVDTSMVFPLASVVDGVTTKGMTTGTNIGPHPMTPETDIPGEIPATGADRAIVAFLTAEVMITVRVPTLRTGVVPEVAPIMTNAASLIAGAIPLITVGNRRM